MTSKTIRFVGASRVNHLVLPFFFNRTFKLTPKERQRALLYAETAREEVRSRFRSSDYPEPIEDEKWVISPSALTAYAFFLRGIAKGRVFRYGAIFHAVGVSAARFNHAEVLQWLIREKVPVDLLHYEGNTLLTTAIRYRHESLATALLEAFPRFSVASKQSAQAMATCIFFGSIPLFFKMVDCGFPISHMVSMGYWCGTLLSAAIRRGRHTITRYLLKHALTSTNVVMPKDFIYRENAIGWTVFREAIQAQNREVLDALKLQGWEPTAKNIKQFCLGTDILDSLRSLTFATSVYPALPFREFMASLREETPESHCIADEIIQHYHLPAYEPDEPSAQSSVQHDWRSDIPSSPGEIEDCLMERPSEILRLLLEIPAQLRAYYQDAKFTLERPLLYALCLAQYAQTPLFSKTELRELVKANSDLLYYSFQTHAKSLGIEIPSRKKVDLDQTGWRLANLRGKALQAFLDQRDEILEDYQTFYAIPIARYIAEEGTVETLEQWMERGFPICAAEPFESWYPIHYANAPILNYYLSEVGLHYRTRSSMEGDTLAWAINADDVACVKVLIEHGYPLNTRKCNEDYPLTYAFLCGSENVAHLLYEAGAKMLDRRGRKMPLPSWFH